jgi:hypothetical protein
MLSLYHMIAFLLVTKQQCLLMSGDVELNPGPLDQGMTCDVKLVGVRIASSPVHVLKKIGEPDDKA